MKYRLVSKNVWCGKLTPNEILTLKKEGAKFEKQVLDLAKKYQDKEISTPIRTYYVPSEK